MPLISNPLEIDLVRAASAAIEAKASAAAALSDQERDRLEAEQLKAVRFTFQGVFGDFAEKITASMIEIDEEGEDCGYFPIVTIGSLKFLCGGFESGEKLRLASACSQCGEDVFTPIRSIEDLGFALDVRDTLVCPKCHAERPDAVHMEPLARLRQLAHIASRQKPNADAQTPAFLYIAEILAATLPEATQQLGQLAGEVFVLREVIARLLPEDENPEITGYRADSRTVQQDTSS